MKTKFLLNNNLKMINQRMIIVKNEPSKLSTDKIMNSKYDKVFVFVTIMAYQNNDM